MKLDIDGTVYECALGFGNVMKIQTLIASNITSEFAAEFDGVETEDMTMDDIPEEYRQNVMANMELMPEVISMCLRTVNGKPISNPAKFVEETLDVSHGMELFNSLMSHINGMLVPKVSKTPSAAQ